MNRKCDFCFIQSLKGRKPIGNDYTPPICIWRSAHDSSPSEYHHCHHIQVVGSNYVQVDEPSVGEARDKTGDPQDGEQERRRLFVNAFVDDAGHEVRHDGAVADALRELAKVEETKPKALPEERPPGVIREFSIAVNVPLST